MSVANEFVRAGWVGAAPRRSEVAAAFVVGVVGVVVAGLQPVLLGALQAGGRLTAAQIGHAATVELLALGAGAGLAETLLQRAPLRRTALVAAIAYVLANLLTLGVRGEGVTLARGLAGLPGGVMIWVVTGVIARAPAPGRWAGAYLAIQTVAQLVVAALLGVVAPNRPSGAPLAMAALGVAAGVAALALPARLAPLPTGERGASTIPPQGWGVLATAALLQACLVAAWVYLEPLGAQARLSPGMIALAAPLCLAAQVAGAGAATLLAARARWFPVLAGSGVALIVVTLALSRAPGAVVLLSLAAAFGFVWMFVLPFLTPWAIAIDPTRRTALLGPAAALVGAALGPLAASLLVGDTDATGALRLAAGFAAAATVLIFGLHLARRRALSAR